MPMKDIEREKLLEAIVFFVENTQWCGAIKLFKLLYFLDMLHFRETGRTVTGLQYTALPWGPVPTPLLEEFRHPKPDLAAKVAIASPAKDVEENTSKLTKITPKEKWADMYLTAREKRIATELAEIFKEANADAMSEISHARGGPWEKARDRNPGKWKEIIDVLDALSPTLKMGSGKAVGKEQLKERMAEFEEAKKLFK
jgi:uncharacterized phage-associated protein